MATIGDNAITSESEDLLGRQRMAESLSREIRQSDTSEGYVLGVVGPWGSGKTSLLHLMANELSRGETSHVVIKFNPWMFTGTEQLVEAFFHELSSQLKETNSRKFADISSTIDRYAELFSPIALIPVVGAWYERAQKVVKSAKKYGDSNKPSVNVRRSELAELLRALDQPIVVTIDDIDRLNTDEIKSLFKLVRLTGNFPNLVYVLAFDRQRVESALSESGLDGRAYLEKIVQHGMQIPEVPQFELIRQLGEALDVALSDVDAKYFDESRWPDLLAEVVAPMVRNMRDVRRYVAAASSAAQDLSGDIDLGDILSLEAVRVFAPDKFDEIVRARIALTVNRADREDSQLREQVKVLVEADGGAKDVMRSLVNRVFPLGSQYIGGSSYDEGFLSSWLRARRLAHPSILALYLERVTPDELNDFIEAEQAYALLEDESAFDEYIRSIEPSRRERVVRSLEAFEDEFVKSSVVPAVTVLLNLIPDLPQRKQNSMYEISDPELQVGRVNLRLLRRLEGVDEVEIAVNEIISRVKTLSSKFSLISMVGHREGAGHQLVSESLALKLEEQLVAEIDAATSLDLSNEWDILRILSTPRFWGLRSNVAITDFSAPELHAAILKNAKTDSLSQSLGSRAVRRSPRLQWEALERVYGNAEAIERAVDAARSISGEAELLDTLTLADKYLSGWRPERL